MSKAKKHSECVPKRLITKKHATETYLVYYGFGSQNQSKPNNNELTMTVQIFSLPN
jgi:hypothetical protein